MSAFDLARGDANGSSANASSNTTKRLQTATKPIDAKLAASDVKLAASITMPSNDTFLSHKNKIRLLYFFYRFSTGSLIPIMSLYMQHAGWSSDQIGKLQSIRPIVTMLSAPLWGGLADRTGKKRLVLMFTFVMSAVFRLLVRFTEGNIYFFAFVLCATSVFFSAVSSLLDSIVVMSLDEHERRDYGKIRLWGEIGNGVSSSMMMYVVNKFHDGFDYVFLVHGVASVVALLFMTLCVPKDIAAPTHTKEDIPNSTQQKQQKLKALERESGWKDGLRVLLGNFQIISLFGMIAITGYSNGLLENFCYINMRQLYTKYGEIDLAGRDISLCRVFLSVGGVLCWYYSGLLQSSFGPDVVMFASVCCLPLCFFLHAGVGEGLGVWTKSGFFVGEAIRSGIFAVLWSSATVRLSELSPPHMKSIMQTVMESIYRGLGHTSGSYFGGVLCQKYGDVSTVFTLVGKCLLSLLCVIMTLGQLKLSPKRKEKKL